jgi:TPP-dependent pyruvate/acetoin dehydrogenase alpha subunit
MNAAVAEIETAHVDPTDFAAAQVNASLTKEKKVQMLRDMMRIRRFEEKAGSYYGKKDMMGGFLHRYDGQESIAVGCASLMGQHDHMITAYRNHGHGLAVGMSMNECMAELFGRAIRAAGQRRGKSDHAENQNHHAELPDESDGRHSATEGTGGHRGTGKAA